MKKYLFAFATLAVLFACTEEPIDPNRGEETLSGDKTVHVIGVSLDRPTVSIMEGESAILVAEVIPEDADNKNVSWSSSDAAVASVDNNGKVTGIKAGSTTVTVKTEDGEKRASCVVTVEAPPAPSVTVNADNISAISVVLRGKANLGSTVASDLTMGIMWSENAGVLPSNSTKVDATNMDGDYNYSVDVTGLEPAKTYYYRSFFTQNGQDTYGETKEFKTKDIESLIETKEASDIEATHATLNAKLDLTDVKYKNITYGFYWGSSESSLRTVLNGGDIADNTFTATMSNLPYSTQYWYKAYVKLDGKTFYGEVKTFTTAFVYVESVSLNATEHTFNTIGNTLTLKATVYPDDASDKSVEWSSDDTGVASVDNNGKVTARGNGTAIITVTTKNQGKTASCAITVAQLITGISLNTTYRQLNEGEEFTLTATIKPDNAANKTLVWSSSDESIATVDQTGKVTAVSKGNAIIKAETQDGSEKSATCSLFVIRPVTSVELSTTSFVLYNGERKGITVTIRPADATYPYVTWTSSNTSIATVDRGIVTGIAPGHATITAKTYDGSELEASCEVEVRQYVTRITLNKADLSMKSGESYKLEATVFPENASDKTLLWTSSNTAVVTVDNSGLINAVAAGSAAITVTANDGSGKQATCNVSVREELVDLGLSVKWRGWNLGASNAEEYGDYYAWGETEPKSDYSLSTYKWCNGSEYSLTKYNTSITYGTVDKKTALDPEDDVAHVILEGKWRMPTSLEWKELQDNCTWTWTRYYNGTNVAGWIVTSNVAGYTDKSIFLPAAGCWYNSSLSYAGSNGEYWSSSLNTETPYKAIFFSFSYYPSSVVVSSFIRCYGASVRPVSD